MAWLIILRVIGLPSSRVNISLLVLATTVPLRFYLSISSSISNPRSVSSEACSLSVLSYRLPLLPHETFSLFINLSKSPSLKHVSVANSASRDSHFG